jgi:hypothetical protein
MFCYLSGQAFKKEPLPHLPPNKASTQGKKMTLRWREGDGGGGRLVDICSCGIKSLLLPHNSSKLMGHLTMEEAV